VVWVGGVSLAVGCYETALVDGVLPDVFPKLTIPEADIAGLASFALSLLLAYRTTSSYRRWEEARAVWGMLVNRSRDLIRQVILACLEALYSLFQFLIFCNDEDDRNKIARWIVALSYSLMWTLRSEHELSDLISGFLSADEISALVNKARFCCWSTGC